ncbi:MAG: DUF1566 domain-containing protein [Treponema sp.]|nr:DUF1566 domain-containing protein [Treponema sp.]
MKKRILSIAVFFIIFLLIGVISCDDPWSTFYLPDYIVEEIEQTGERGTSLGPVSIIANGAPATGTSLTTNYAGSDVSFQWVIINPSGTITDIPASQGGNNSVFYPSEPGTYAVIITTNNVPSPLSNPIIIGGDSSSGSLLANSVSIFGSGKPGGKLTASCTPNLDDASYQWYLNGIPIPAPQGVGSEFTPTTSGLYTVSAIVDGHYPKQSSPVRVSESGGLGIEIRLTSSLGVISPSLALNASKSPATVSTSITAAIEPNISGVTYRWFGPGKNPNADPPPDPDGTVAASPLLTLGVWTVVATNSTTGQVRERQFPVTLGTLAGTFEIVGSGKPGEPLTAKYTHSTNPQQTGSVTFEWLRNGNPLSPVVKTEAIPTSGTPPSATTPAFSPTQLGVYSVRVSVPGFYDRHSNASDEASPVRVNVTDTGGLLGHISIRHNIPGVGLITFEPEIPARASDTTGNTVTALYNPAGESGPFTYEWYNPNKDVNAVPAPSPDLTNETGVSPILNVPGLWTVKAIGPAPDRRAIERTVEVLPSLSGTIVIKGSGKRNQPLTAEYSGTEPGRLYQWLRETAPGSLRYEPITLNATNVTYTPAADGNHLIRITAPGYAPLISSPAVDVSPTGGLKGTINLSSLRDYRKTATLTYNPGAGIDATPGFTYVWRDPNGNENHSQNQNTPVPNISSALTPILEPDGQWMLIITDANGRVRELPFTVVKPNLNGTLTITGSGRLNEPLTALYIHASGQGLDGDPIEYQWLLNGNPLVPNVTTPQITPTTAGNYTVRVTVYGYNDKTYTPEINVQAKGGLPGTVKFNPSIPGRSDPVTASLDPPVTGVTYQWYRRISPDNYETLSGSGANTATYTPNQTGWYKVVITETATDRVIEGTVEVLGKLSGSIVISGTGKPGGPLDAEYTGTEPGNIEYRWEQLINGVWTQVSTNNPFTPTEEGEYRVIVWMEEYAPWWGTGSGIGVDRRGGLSGTLGAGGATAQTGRTTTANWSTTVAGPFSIKWFRPDGTQAGTTASGNLGNNTSPLLDMHGEWRVVVEGPNDRSREIEFEVIRTNHVIRFNTMGGMPRDIDDISNVPYNTINIPSFPADPTRRGYRFDGWFTDVNFGAQFTHGTTPVRTMTATTLILQLFAKWDFNNSLTIGSIALGTGNGQIVFYVAPGELNYFTFFGSATDTSGTNTYYLEAAPSDSGSHSWSSTSVVVGDTGSARGMGRRNTLRILLGDPAAAAANIASGSTHADLEDWYLPSIDELRDLYNARNNASFGGSLTGIYWSSTQDPANSANALALDFDNGQTISRPKTEPHKVRLIRAF